MITWYEIVKELTETLPEPSYATGWLRRGECDGTLFVNVLYASDGNYNVEQQGSFKLHFVPRHQIGFYAFLESLDDDAFGFVNDLFHNKPELSERALDSHDEWSLFKNLEIPYIPVLNRTASTLKAVFNMPKPEAFETPKRTWFTRERLGAYAGNVIPDNEVHFPQARQQVLLYSPNKKPYTWTMLKNMVERVEQ